MASTFILKKHDTLPWLRATLLTEGNAIDLTTADSVKFLAKQADEKNNPKLMDKPAAITDAAAGSVQVVWGPADTDTAGTFNCEFEITWDPGYIQTIPNDGYFILVIHEDLG